MNGLRRDKFAVAHHMRGDLEPGECFVLVPRRDPAAVAAIRAYGRATSDVILASELEGWADAIEGADPVTLDDQELNHRIPIWTATLARQVRNGTMSIETALQRIAGHAAFTSEEHP